MISERLSENTKNFLLEHINSVEQLEVLLLLHAHWQKEWLAEEVSKEMRIEHSSATLRLADLHNRGILVVSKSSPCAYRYHPKKTELDRAINELSSVYSQQRVTIITLIFSKPVDKIRTFSDELEPKPED